VWPKYGRRDAADFRVGGCVLAYQQVFVPCKSSEIAQPPADIVREHIRVSVQPFDDVPDRQLPQIIEWIGEDVLMYASDYPHGYDDEFPSHLSILPPPMQRKIMSENARKHYRL
jgi:predicted TIM-barrel fold metal-dependent hydrolase